MSIELRVELTTELRTQCGQNLYGCYFTTNRVCLRLLLRISRFTLYGYVICELFSFEIIITLLGFGLLLHLSGLFIVYRLLNLQKHGIINILFLKRGLYLWQLKTDWARA